jgi:S-adenosylmethionine-diacylglycerol 3-amino-3-carboxypropyl transferase
MSIFNSVLFAVNREDHYVEYDVINRLDPNRMLMIGSGGCIALSIKTTYPDLDLNVIDVNPHQLTHINKKSKAVQCSDLKELNVHTKNDSCLNQAGKFETMFQELRDSFIELVSNKKELLSFFDSDMSDISRSIILEKWTNHNNISTPFQNVFNDKNINKVFSDEATKHGSPGSYISYMKNKILTGLNKKDSHLNPFLQHIFLGYYLSDNAFPYMKSKNKLDIPMTEGSILNLDNIYSYDVVSLSNIFDWSSDTVVKTHARYLSQMKKGSAIIIRQINNHKNWIEIFNDYFTEDKNFDSYWQEHDRSMFYDHIRLFIRK